MNPIQTAATQDQHQAPGYSNVPGLHQSAGYDLTTPLRGMFFHFHVSSPRLVAVGLWLSNAILRVVACYSAKQCLLNEWANGVRYALQLRLQ